jgi:hypothetical protein
MIDARIKINEYTNRVFGVVKAKYGLKDKSDAINKFVKLYGHNEIGEKINDTYIQKLNDIEKKHIKKYGYKNMKNKELVDLFK